MTILFAADDKAVLLDSKKRRYLIDVTADVKRKQCDIRAALGN